MVFNKSQAKPRSKKDRTLPYTYEGWVDILNGQGTEPVYDHYFCDTLCGLIEALDEDGLDHQDVRLFGLFKGKKSELDTSLCIDPQGNWLHRPQLCHVLEQHYEHSHQECYKGHVEKGHCLFEDRDRQGSGPIW